MALYLPQVQPCRDLFLEHAWPSCLASCQNGWLAANPSLPRYNHEPAIWASSHHKSASASCQFRIFVANSFTFDVSVLAAACTRRVVGRRGDDGDFLLVTRSDVLLARFLHMRLFREFIQIISQIWWSARESNDFVVTKACEVSDNVIKLSFGTGFAVIRTVITDGVVLHDGAPTAVLIFQWCSIIK